MNFKVITSEKYLQYFLSDCEHSIEDDTMTDFLNDMISVSEQMDMTVPPTEIMKVIMKRCELDGSPLNNVSLIATSNLLETLNTLEVFTLLWYVSCRNALAYDEGLYLNMVNNKTIGNLLKGLSVLCK